MLVTQTNLHAAQFRRNNPNLSANACANLWVETTRDEMKKFIALSLLMGIVKTPEHRVFQPNLICWSSEEEEEIHHSSSIEEFLEDCDALTEVEGNERKHKVITFFVILKGSMGTYCGFIFVGVILTPKRSLKNSFSGVKVSTDIEELK